MSIYYTTVYFQSITFFSTWNVLPSSFRSWDVNSKVKLCSTSVKQVRSASGDGISFRGLILLPSGKLTARWLENGGPGLKMYFLLKMGIFPIAMLVYWRVTKHLLDVANLTLLNQQSPECTFCKDIRNHQWWLRKNLPGAVCPPRLHLPCRCVPARTLM